MRIIKQIDGSIHLEQDSALCFKVNNEMQHTSVSGMWMHRPNHNWMEMVATPSYPNLSHKHDKRRNSADSGSHGFSC